MGKIDILGKYYLSEKGKESFFATEDKCLKELMQFLMCYVAIDEMPEDIKNEKIRYIIYTIAVTREIAEYYFKAQYY